MNLIDGRALAAKIRSTLNSQLSTLGSRPGLGVILVGNDPASHLYIKLKKQACADAGIYFEKKIFSESASPEEINKTIQQFNNRNDIHGILVQLPLPTGFDTDEIIKTIDPKKDVDGFHPENLKLLKIGKPRIIPPVAAGIMKLIESTGVKLKNKKATLLVNSDKFAIPLRYLLEEKGVLTKTLIPNSKFLIPDLKNYDIIIIALGRPNFLKSDMVKDGAIIIDVGTTKVGEKIIGDADFESFAERDVWITPVPGGVGPMTVAMLLQNIFLLTTAQQ